MNPSRSTPALRIAAYAFAGAFLLLSVAGTVGQYAPVPIYDQWTWIVDWYARHAGDLHAWWGEHREHPIILARPLYWLDCAAFRCNEISLLVIDHALIVAMAALLLAIGRRMLRDSPTHLARESTTFVIAAFAFSWLQWANLTQGFQVVFFAAYVMPFMAFASLARAASAPHRCAAFVTALALGIASAFTMGNAVIVLPILALMAVLTRQSMARIATTVLCAIAIAYGYLANFGATPRDAGSLVAVADRVAFLKFGLVLIGSPAGGITDSTLVAGIAGVVIVGATTVAALSWHRRRSPDELALLAFVGYVVVSSFGAAAARSYLGVPYALSSRYQTPALLAWPCVFLLVLARARSLPVASRALGVIGLLGAVALVPAQLRALGDSMRYRSFERTFAALALELGIHDTGLVRTLYPLDDVYAMAETARARGLAIFGEPALSGLRATIGRPVAEVASARCDVQVDGTDALPDAPGTTRIVGVVDVSKLPAKPARVYLATAEGRIVGAGVIAGPFTDWRGWMGPRAGHIRFGGYVLADRAEALTGWCPAS